MPTEQDYVEATGDLLSKADQLAEEVTNFKAQNNIGSAVASINGKTGAVVLSKADLGLEHVDNTSDLEKAISTAVANKFAQYESRIFALEKAVYKPPEISELSFTDAIGHAWDFKNRDKGTLTDNLYERYAPEYGSTDLIQTVASQRPKRNNDYLAMSRTHNDNIGFVTDGDITYTEIFILADYDHGLNFTHDNMFDGNAVLMSGTGAAGERRVIGSSYTNNLLTSYSVDSAGRISINNNSPQAQDILPLTMSAIMAANFDSTRSTTDTVTFGYSPAYPNRAWPCHMGCIIAFNRALTAEERLELNAWAQKRTAYAEAPSEEPLDGDVAIVLYTTQSNGYFGKAEDISDLPTPRADVRYYVPSTGNLVTADETAIEYLDGTTGSVEKSGSHVAFGKALADELGKPVVLVVVEHAGKGFANDYFKKGQAGYNAAVNYALAAKAKIEEEGKTAYIAHWHNGIIEVEESNRDTLQDMLDFNVNMRADLSSLMNTKTPMTCLSPTYAWRTSGDYGQAAVHEIYKEIFTNIIPHAYYIESDETWETLQDVFGSIDSTHYAQRTQVNQIKDGMIEGHRIAKAKSSVNPRSFAPKTVYNMVAVNDNGTLDCYGYKTTGGDYLDGWFSLGKLIAYEWDLVVADDEDRTNETVLATVVDNGTAHHATYALPTDTDEKYYYAILRGEYQQGDTIIRSEFVVQDKYHHTSLAA